MFLFFENEAAAKAKRFRCTLFIFQVKCKILYCSKHMMIFKLNHFTKKFELISAYSMSVTTTQLNFTFTTDIGI